MITRDTITIGSNKKAWFRCPFGHEWMASVSSITSGRGCPYCANKKVCLDNCLATTHPEIAKRWHPTKNGSLTPSDVTSGSGKIIWWRCENKHAWESTLYNLSHGNGCPYCANRAVCLDNCLATTHPELASEWHPTKNGALTPYDVVGGTNRDIWWKCPNGHEWETQGTQRTKKNGTNCPYCANQRVCKDNCLAIMNPEIAKLWHPTKNGDLTPYDVFPCTAKQIFWLCKMGHTWKASPNNMKKTCGCPYCAGKRATRKNCLSTLHPNIALEWHPTKNNGLIPDNVTSGSAKKFWWKCKVCKHEWLASVKHRTRNNGHGSGCPACAGRVATKRNCLYTTHPEIAKRWHPTKNGDLTPYDVTSGSNKRAWFICPKCNSAYEQVIYSARTVHRCKRCSSIKERKNDN